MGSPSQLDSLADLAVAISKTPDDASLWHKIGFIYLSIGEHKEALDTFQASQSINPTLADGWFGEAITLFELGRHHSALEKLGMAINRNPRDQRLWSARAHMLSALAESPATVLEAYQDWARRFATNAQTLSGPTPVKDRRIRVGYISADFRQHALSYFFLPLLREHDKQRFEIYGLFTGQADSTTAEFELNFEHWHAITQMDDGDACRYIRNLELDLLVDLSGHTHGTRLPMLANRPAPRQISWYGYNCTTGMKAIDFRLTDSVMDPDGNDAFSTERLLRLPHFACYSPPKHVFERTPLPVLNNGFITFGSLNNPQKLTDTTLALWKTLLDRLPTARLRIIAPYGPTGKASSSELWSSRFAQLGFPMSRIDMLPKMSLTEFLAQAEHIDIALEPTPFSGGVTTCHALWMGLPCITLTGEMPFSRAAASILAAAGLSELVASTSEEYLRIAVDLTQDHNRLTTLRRELPDRLLQSPLMNHQAHTRALEAIFQQVCAS